MNQSKLFRLTRLRFTTGYALVMGLALCLGSLIVYEGIIAVHQKIVQQKLTSLAGVLHDSIEPALERPGQLPIIAQQLAPGLCGQAIPCVQPNNPSGRHMAAVFQASDYYVRFLSQSGQSLAEAGQQPEAIPSSKDPFWQTVRDRQGDRYYQISWQLRTKDNLPWGYLQVGQSLQQWDEFLASIRLFLLFGLPFAMLLIGLVSWWLAGLAMQPIYRSYRQMQQFTSDAAHELRTPLTVVQSTVEDTWLAEDLPAVHRNLDIIERQTIRLSELVKDLLLICRVEQQHQLLKLQPCCLNDLVCDLVEELAGLALAAEVALLTDLRVKEAVLMMGDEAQLYRMVSNLLTNAIRYTPPGGKVKVVLDRTDHEALIQVQDTGMGIAATDQTRIFDRFYRVQRDRSRTTGGVGLGLSIVQAIVHAHAGKIQLQSAVGKGSTFTVRFPLFQ